MSPGPPEPGLARANASVGLGAVEAADDAGAGGWDDGVPPAGGGAVDEGETVAGVGADADPGELGIEVAATPPEQAPTTIERIAVAISVRDVIFVFSSRDGMPGLGQDETDAGVAGLALRASRPVWACRGGKRFPHRRDDLMRESLGLDEF
jgi:hypothetical protein